MNKQSVPKAADAAEPDEQPAPRLEALMEALLASVRGGGDAPISCLRDAACRTINE
jgi:hypothetical protein